MHNWFFITILIFYYNYKIIILLQYLTVAQEIFYCKKQIVVTILYVIDIFYCYANAISS